MSVWSDVQEMREKALQNRLPAVPEVLDAVTAILLEKAEAQERLERAALAKQEVQFLEDDAVRSARADGESWGSIASYMGMSRAGVRKRYHSPRDDDLDAFNEVHAAELKMVQAEYRRQATRLSKTLEVLSEAELNARPAPWQELVELHNMVSEVQRRHRAERQALLLGE